MIYVVNNEADLISDRMTADKVFGMATFRARTQAMRHAERLVQFYRALLNQNTPRLQMVKSISKDDAARGLVAEWTDDDDISVTIWRIKLQ